MKSHTKPALRAMPAAQVQISLPVQGVLRDVHHAFLGLCIDAGQKVLAAMMEADRMALCGPKGVPDARRRAVRGGTTASQIVLGGQRIAVRRPRARSTTRGELALPSFQWAACDDPLDAATMAAIAAGVSTQHYASTQEPVRVAHKPRAASKSAVSRSGGPLTSRSEVTRTPNGSDAASAWAPARPEVYAGEKSTKVYDPDVWLPEETLQAVREYAVSIKGPLTTPVGGGIRSLNVALRQELDLYVCLRPIQYFKGVPSPLKEPEKTHMVIFRENSEGIYAGIEWEAESDKAKKVIKFLREEMGVKKIRFPDTSGIGIKPVSREGTGRLVRKAIQYAIDNDKPSVTIVHKGNIMKFTEADDIERKVAREVWVPIAGLKQPPLGRLRHCLLEPRGMSTRG